MTLLSPSNVLELEPGVIAACKKLVSQGRWEFDAFVMSEFHPAVGSARTVQDPFEPGCCAHPSEIC